MTKYIPVSAGWLSGLAKPVASTQGRPEKLRGPWQRVKVGPQWQGGFHSKSQLHPSCKTKKKKKGHDLLTMRKLPSPTISPYI